MKKLLFLLVALAMGVVVSHAEQIDQSYNTGINIIPVPKQLVVLSGDLFTINSKTVIVVGTPDFAAQAAYLADKIKGSTGYELKLKEITPKSNYISLIINTRIPAGMEGYTLNSSVNGVVIEARTPQGAFYGVQSLLQLLPAQIESSSRIKSVKWTLPSVSIVDEPRFKYRGVMLDPARHFVSIDFIKKQLDVLAMFKINRFHWHLTDDQGWRIEIKKYPNLAKAGSVRTEGDGSTYGPYFYTQDQIKDLVAYANERYIDVIPEIELPGHGLAALAGYPEFSCTGGPFKPRIIWGVEDDVYCVGKEATFEFWQDVLDEVTGLFPSKYFHIGGDECPKVRWAKCPDCQARAKALGLSSQFEKIGNKVVKHSVEDQLQSYAVTRVEKYLAAKGKQMIGWDEILEGGLAPRAIVMSWRGVDGGIMAANQDHEVIMTPGSDGMYINYYQGSSDVEPMAIGGLAMLSETYAYEPVPAGLDASKRHYIIGAQCNLWSEYLLSESLVEYMLYPRLLAVAEMTWSDPSKKDFADFSHRVNNAYVRLDYHDINYHIPLAQGVTTRNVVFTDAPAKLIFNNSRNYPMVYTVDGQEPSDKSDKYIAPIEISENATLQIATLLPSGKLSTVRSINVEKQIPSAALVDTLSVGVSLADTVFATDGSVVSITFKGRFKVPQNGVYTFATDMNLLTIDQELLIDNNGVANRHQNQKVQKALACGWHDYSLLFKNLIQNGLPQQWNYKTFDYKLEPSGSFVTVKTKK